MIKTLLIVLLLACSCVAFKPCEPFGPRIFYGQQIKDASSQQKMVIYFNTVSPCQRSYAQLVTKAGIVKVQCATTTLKLSAKTNNYIAYIHKCKTDQIKYQETFYYNAFGWDGSAVNPISLPGYVQTFLANPLQKSRTFKYIVLADWSKIQTNLYKYTPIDDMMLHTRAAEEINALIVLGDIGYDLDTNNCQNYQKFLTVLQKVAAGLPIIMVTGNHQYNTDDNWSLFVQSFEHYGLDTDLAVGLSLGSSYLVPFDPYSLLYETKIADNVAGRLQAILKSAQNNGQFVVPCSHYPLACSGSQKKCKTDRNDMKAYWDSMISNGVSLYLGAHYHTYQRLYPYVKGDKFMILQQDYEGDKEYLISIVQGVAGNDRDIIQSIDQIEAFTASHTVGQTGFGIMQVDSSKASYRHLSTKSGQVDKISISRAKSQKGTKQLRQQ